LLLRDNYFKHQLALHSTDSDHAMPCQLAFTYVDLSLEQSTMLASWLSPNELAVLGRRKQLAAKNEFIASRLLLKHLIARDFSVPYCELTVLFNPESNQLEARHLNTLLPISAVISHSHGAVAACVSNTPMKLGLDIEFTEKQRAFEKLAAHFYQQEEISLILSAEHTSDCFYRIWTLKEALAKTISKPIAALLSQNVFNEIETHNLAVVSGRLGGHDISVITEAPVVKNVRKIPLHQLVQSSLVKL
jgi:4'-phosphopantetheinyl transferase